jgi:hypothetical protein
MTLPPRRVLAPCRTALPLEVLSCRRTPRHQGLNVVGHGGRDAAHDGRFLLPWGLASPSKFSIHPFIFQKSKKYIYKKFANPRRRQPPAPTLAVWHPPLPPAVPPTSGRRARAPSLPPVLSPRALLRERPWHPMRWQPRIEGSTLIARGRRRRRGESACRMSRGGEEWGDGGGTTGAAPIAADPAGSPGPPPRTFRASPSPCGFQVKDDDIQFLPPWSSVDHLGSVAGNVCDPNDFILCWCVFGCGIARSWWLEAEMSPRGCTAPDEAASGPAAWCLKSTFLPVRQCLEE